MKQDALGYAEVEALENFASAAPTTTCTSLAGSTELREADRVVAEWRTTRPAS